MHYPYRVRFDFASGPAAALALTLAWTQPAFSAEPLIPIKTFVQASKFREPRLSPDGKHLAIQVTQEIDGRDQKLLNIYALDGFKLESTLRFPVFQMPFGYRWVSNTRLVVPKAEDWGDREVPVFLGEIFATDFDGQNQEYLYGKDKFAFQRRGATSGGDDYGWGYVHSIPDQLNGHFFLRERKWDRKSNRSFLYDVDARNGVKKLIADVGSRDLDYLLQHDGTPRFAFGGNDNNRQIGFIRDRDRDNWQALPAERVGSDFDPIAFTPDDKAFFLLFSQKGEPTVLMRESMDGGERTLVAGDRDGSINMIQYGPGTHQPFAVASELGIPTVRYVDESSPEAQLHKVISAQFPGQYVDFATFSADGNKLLFYVHSDREPGEYYLYDRISKKAEFLIARQPLIDAARMAERKPIQFKARDGLELHGYLTLPPKREAKKLPLILIPHGGPQGVADHWFFDPDAQFLASRGYAVLQVNYRGSGGRGDGFFNAGNRQWATGMQHDLIDGVRWLIAEGTADAAKVCVYGASFGAYAAMMTSILEPDLFKCAVGYAGLYDLTMVLGSDRAKQNRRAFNFWTEAMGDDPEALKRDSPAFLADKLKVPVLLVHGEQDETTPPAQAESMRAALTRANKAFEWMMVPKEGHGFYAEKNRLAFYEKLEAFFAKNLHP
jgi:dipeptidyl aminopeptidase/acylaminoacyl peptidase